MKHQLISAAEFEGACKLSELMGDKLRNSTIDEITPLIKHKIFDILQECIGELKDALSTITDESEAFYNTEAKENDERD